MHYTQITFPHIQLQTRDGHKLRGYIGRLFREHSPLLHNHFADGSLRYAYPLVQYKVIGGIPMLIGIGEGSQLLTQLFLQLHELRLEEQVYPLYQKHMKSQDFVPKIENELHTYQFVSPWLALTQKNYQAYRQLLTEEVGAFLQTKLRNHLITFLKAVESDLSNPLLVQVALNERRTRFKNQQMTAFVGTFVANVQLPDAIGIGKSVSRGFGTIRKVQQPIFLHPFKTQQDAAIH